MSFRGLVGPWRWGQWALLLNCEQYYADPSAAARASSMAKSLFFFWMDKTVPRPRIPATIKREIPIGHLKLKHASDGGVHVREVGYELNDQGVEGPEAQDCAHTCGPHDDGVLSDTKDDRNRVNGKDNIGELNHHEHKKQRSALSFMHEVSTVVPGIDRNALGRPDNAHVV